MKSDYRPARFEPAGIGRGWMTQCRRQSSGQSWAARHRSFMNPAKRLAIIAAKLRAI